MTTTEESVKVSEEDETCNCKCVARIKNLEDKISDLVILRDKVEKFQRLMDSLIAGTYKKNKPEAPVAPAKQTQPPPEIPVSEVKEDPDPKVEPVPPAPPSPPVQELNDEGGDNDDDVEPMIPEVIVEERSVEPLPIDASNGIENVEITPDFFGHFLLDNPAEDDNNATNENDNQVDDDEDDAEEGEVSRSSRKRQRDRYDDSDSEDCFTISDSDVSTEDYTSDEEYRPTTAKGGRGRGRPRLMMDGQNKYTKFPSSASQPPPKPLKLDSDTTTELMRSCTKRPGGIWECNVCGFMLSSLDNMLLHVKYNHSTTTHTCPFCKVVVLCRSPKDALMHQVACKLRPEGVKCQRPNQVPVPVPVQQGTTTTRVNSTSAAGVKNSVAHKRHTVAEIDEKVNQFVADLLEPSTSSRVTRNRAPPPPAPAPAVVTLSSDEDDDDDESD